MLCQQIRCNFYKFIFVKEFHHRKNQGINSVHTYNIEPGNLFQDQSISELCDKPFSVKANMDVELVIFDFDYFKIIAGSAEVKQIRQELQSTLTDEDIIRIWVNDEK